LFLRRRDAEEEIRRRTPPTSGGNKSTGSRKGKITQGISLSGGESKPNRGYTQFNQAVMEETYWPGEGTLSHRGGVCESVGNELSFREEKKKGK